VCDFERLAAAQDVHAGVVLVTDGELLRDEQLAVVRAAIKAIHNELRRGRGMVNRVLRIARDGEHDIVECPTGR
jgi:hypothetical protein